MKAYSLLTLSFLLVGAIGTARINFAQESAPSATSGFRKSVILPKETTGEFTSILLDRELYSGTTELFHDLRLLDSSEKEVPFLLHRQVKEERKSQRIPTTIAQPQVRPLEDDRLEIIFTIDREKHPHSIDGITLSTRLRDFEHRVTVETRTSDDSPWRTLATNVLIYDYSRYMDVRNLEVPFAEKSLNKGEGTFRITIEKVTQEKESQLRELTRSLKEGVASDVQEKLMINRENLKLDSISFWQIVESVVSSGPVLTEYPIQIESRREDEKLKQTVIEFTSHREPLKEIELATEDKNFHRKVTLYAILDSSTDLSSSTKETYLTQSSVTKISLPNNSRAELVVTFPATRSTRYRLVIDNADNPPLKDITLKAKGETFDILFLAQPSEEYSVVYGNTLLESPKYDVLAIQTAIDLQMTPNVGSLDPAVAYTISDPRSEWEKILENRWLLGTLFAVLILVLGATLYQASKRLSSIS